MEPDDPTADAADERRWRQWTEEDGDPAVDAAEERQWERWEQGDRRGAERWARSMLGLFLTGIAGVVASYLSLASGYGNQFLVSGVSAVLNLISWYAIRRGGTVRPDRFPVRWHGRLGPETGTNIAPMLVLLSVLPVVIVLRR